MVCQSVWHCGIGNDRMPGIAALGMTECPALRHWECQGVWHWFFLGFLNAKGSGIGNVRMLGIAALGMSECLALRHWFNFGGVKNDYFC